MSASGHVVHELVELRDGSQVLIRPIEPRDGEMLLAGFEMLSPESRYRRFFTPLTTLDSRWLTYLTEVDHRDHEALVAESVATGEPVGVARYIRLPEQPTAAEMAVTVVDHWQGKGAASALLALLSRRAQAEGITRFHATCLAENRAVLELLRGFATERSEKTTGNVVEIDMDLPAELERGNPLHAALTHAASGTLTFRHPQPTRAAQGTDRT
jgi:RimJ/RimL family protein N-acetyltransferase